MSNIILQHFDGELRELDKLSIDNIKQYADKISADYELIRGKPFREHLTAACQKVHMISEAYDKYDDVLMVDIDMFVPKGMNLNVFEQVGCGLYNPIQQNLHRRLAGSNLRSQDAPYWGGAIYKFNKQRRENLRQGLNGDESWMNQFNKPYHYEDEGIIHFLAVKAGMSMNRQDIMDPRWCYDSYLGDPASAYMIHVRTKITPQGPKRNKIKNYQYLAKQGIL
tara:strand:+ start:215 stop:883 length:669 start_codon:yes stop_codon:yes gene_type:complete